MRKCYFYSRFGDLIRIVELSSTKPAAVWGSSVFIRADLTRIKVVLPVEVDPTIVDVYVEVDYHVVKDTAPSGYLRTGGKDGGKDTQAGREDPEEGIRDGDVSEDQGLVG